MSNQTAEVLRPSSRAPVLELRLMPVEWRAVLFGLGSFVLDIQHAAAELEEVDAIASPVLAPAYTAFQVTIRTTLSLRSAIDVALERNQSAQRFRRGKTAGSGRVAVRHTALSALPSILDDSAQRLVEAGHALQAEAMRAIARKVSSALP
jgi:hypothetical protein